MVNELSWMYANYVCRACNYQIVITQGGIGDYIYYCSNPKCENHNNKEDLGDMEECSFAKVINEIAP